MCPYLQQRRKQLVAEILTPVSVERRLVNLSKEIDEGHKQLSDAEYGYHQAKVEYEIKIAEVRMSLNESGIKMRVQDVEDMALIQCRSEYTVLNIAEATVKAARANANRLRTQVDIVRSVGTSVRASLEV